MLGAWIVTVLIGVSLFLAPVHHATAGVVPVSDRAVALHALHGVDHPCTPDGRAGADKAAAVCTIAGGACVLALSPAPNAAPFTPSSDAVTPTPVSGPAGWDHSPTPPPPRTLDA